jgi:radical SAM superfamily enzyme YgiQ (UPF0313 family)
VKIVLTHAYFLENDPKEQKIMKPYPPLGLLSLSAWLSKNGYPNEVYDTTFGSEKDQRVYLETENPDVIAIYTNLMTKVALLDLMRFIKTSPKLSRTTIVLGGPDFTYNAENYLKAGADIGVIGEGENTMLDIVVALNNDQSVYQHIDGIAYISEKGEFVKTKERQKIKEINDLPWPDRTKIDLHKYLEVWKKHHGKNSITISTQRGCPYTCKWCSTAVYGQSYRRRSPENVVAEMKHIQTTYNPDQIWFVDDVFTVSHKWLREFVIELKKQKVSIPFECISRADRMNQEVLDLLKESDCFRIWIGAESGSQKVLDAMDRRVNSEWVRTIIKDAKHTGLETGTFIMLGYPGETEEDIIETYNHLVESDPDLYTITVAYPIKGTSLYQEVEESFINKPAWENSTDRDIDFKRTYPGTYYHFAVKWLVNKLNLRKIHINGLTSLTTYSKILLKIKLARAGMLWSKKMG